MSVRSSSKRRSALHRAAIHGHESVTRVLIMAGADVGSLDSDRRSPLHLAVRAGHEQLVCSLLLGGANPSTKDKKGNAPLHIAAWHGHAGISCALLLKGADKNVLDCQGRSPLHLAAEHGHGGAADALLAAGADATLRYGENELSVLDSAASYGHVKVLRALIQHGVDVNDTDSTGYTALHMAADNNQAGAVGVLVEAGADVESQDLHHWTPLHCVARYMRRKTVIAQKPYFSGIITFIFFQPSGQAGVMGIAPSLVPLNYNVCVPITAITGHYPTRGSGQRVFKISQAGSDRVRRF